MSRIAGFRSLATANGKAHPIELRPRVVAFVKEDHSPRTSDRDGDRLYLSAITLAEIKRGIARAVRIEATMKGRRTCTAGFGAIEHFHAGRLLSFYLLDTDLCRPDQAPGERRLSGVSSHRMPMVSAGTRWRLKCRAMGWSNRYCRPPITISISTNRKAMLPKIAELTKKCRFRIWREQSSHAHQVFLKFSMDACRSGCR
ncbi:hypothetical protein AB9E16_06060, partial [Rhizobium leguminosarum]